MKKILATMLFAVGISLILYPFVSKIVSYNNQTKVVQEYHNINKNDEEIEMKKEASTKYNEDIKEDFRIVNFDGNIPEEENNVYDYFKTGDIIGTLNIEKISAVLPIYDSTDGESLEKGVCLLQGTSYPNGEIGTHSVLAGHSGLTSAKILDDADKLVIGDTFSIDYLGELSNYEIINIQKVLPNETDSLKIQEDETLVTLCTCTPKYLNTHRLLITAKKVEKEEVKDVIVESTLIRFLKINYEYFIVIIIVSILGILGLLLINKLMRRG